MKPGLARYSLVKVQLKKGLLETLQWPFLVLANSHALRSSIARLTRLSCLVLVQRHGAGGGAGCIGNFNIQCLADHVAGTFHIQNITMQAGNAVLGVG